MTSVFEKIVELEKTHEAFVIVTLLKTRGHAPQDVGSKALITHQGLAFGTVGGGKVEFKALQHAQKMMNEKLSTLESCRWNLQRDVGMSCGGEVEFLFEVIRPRPWKIVVFGAGHVSQALTPLLVQLQAQVTCVDTRSEWLEKLPPGAKTLCVERYQDAVPLISEDSFCVVMTQGHATDFPVLLALMQNQNPPYLGVIGSPIKAQKIRQELREHQISNEKIEKLHGPIGLKIGNTNHPMEIAISIAAELISQRTAMAAPRMAKSPPTNRFHENSCPSTP